MSIIPAEDLLSELMHGKDIVHLVCLVHHFGRPVALCGHDCTLEDEVVFDSGKDERCIACAAVDAEANAQGVDDWCDIAPCCVRMR